MPPVPTFILAWHSRLERRSPIRHNTGVVVRMDGSMPAALKRFRHADARVFAPTLVQKIDRPIGRRAPHIAGNRVDHGPKLSLGFTEFFDD